MLEVTVVTFNTVVHRWRFERILRRKGKWPYFAEKKAKDQRRRKEPSPFAFVISPEIGIGMGQKSSCRRSEYETSNAVRAFGRGFAHSDVGE